MDHRKDLALLAREHRKLVDEFVEAVLSQLPTEAGIEQWNALGLAVRFHTESVLVPGLLAVAALLLKAGPEALNRELPQWIERTSSVLPAEADLLTEAGRRVDPAGYALLEENLDLTRGQCLAVEMFHAYLLGLAPGVPRTPTSTPYRDTR